MKAKMRRELVFSKVFLTVLILLGLLLVVWLGWVSPAQKEKSIDSFEDCVAAGYPVQESYPEMCVGPDSKRFANPRQQ